MKKALFTDTLRQIWATKNRFFSILAIIALGSGFFAGVKATCPDMLTTAREYFDEYRLMDIHMLSTVGFDDESVEEISKYSGIDSVYAGYSSDLYVQLEESANMAVKVYSLDASGSINAPELLEGRMPQAPNECLVELNSRTSDYFSLGKTITFASGDDNELSDILAYDSYTIVGIVRWPMYIGFERGTTSLGNGTLESYILLPDEAFSYEAYTDIFIRLKSTEGLSPYTDEYEKAVEDAVNVLEVMGDGIILENRIDRMLSDAREELEDAKNKYNDGLSEYNSGVDDFNREISDAEAELSDAKQQLEDGKTEYNDGLQQYLDNLKEYEDGLAEFNREIADAEAELSDARRQLDDGWAEYYDGLAELEKAKSDFEQGIAEGEAELQAAKIKYESGIVKYENGQKEYYDGIQQYHEGLSQYNSALAAYQAALEGYNRIAAALDALKQQQQQPDTGGSEGDGSEGEDYPMPSLPSESIEQLEAQLARAKALLDEYEAELNAAKEQLDEASSQIGSGAAELSRTPQQLEEAKQQIKDGEAEFETRRAEGEAQIAEAEQKLAEALAELEEGEAEYLEGYTDFIRGKAESEATFKYALEALEAAKEQLDEASLELLDADSSILDGESELEKAKADGEKELSDAKAELDDGEKELSDAEKEIEEIVSEAELYIFDRTAQPDYAAFETDSERIDSIAKVFPVFFVLVAALVCLTTMTRMVEEQRTQIGTLKALGYSRGSIVMQFLLFAFTASIAGCLIGLIIGFNLLPTIIFNAYRMMYCMPPVIAEFKPGYAIGCVVVALACTGLSSLAACYRELISVPAQLMRPKPPKNGKRVFLERITFIWKRLKFTYKVTVRNLFRYGSRVLMTVVGVAGCTALILTGFGLRHSISAIVDKQYGEIFVYDFMTIVDGDAEEEEKERLLSEMMESGYVSDMMTVVQKSEDIFSETESFNAYVFAPEDIDRLSDFIILRDRKTLADITPQHGDTVIINEKLAKLLDVSVGDTVTIGDSERPLTITGITENYAYNYLYISLETYKELFPEQEFNVIIGDMTDISEQDAFSSMLLQHDSVLAISHSTDGGAKFRDMIDSLDFIVVVIIIAAGALAFVVLYNLANVNVTERIRELATIKVLGFYDREVSAYIYRENTISSVMGIAVGLVLGIFLERFVITTAEVDVVMFSPELPAYCFVFAALITMAFTLIVNITLHFRLKKIDMATSLKAIE